MHAELLSIALAGGLLAVAGGLLYSLGDVLMLAPKIGPTRPNAPDQSFFALFPALQRSADMLETLARIPSRRLAWGGLLGVFASPLVLAGLGPLFLALAPAGLFHTLPVTILLAYGLAIGPFIHSSFIFLGEAVHTLAEAAPEAQEAQVQRVARLQRVLVISYVVLFACLIGASLWYSAAVLLGATRLPLWMAACSPFTLTLSWMLVRRGLPRRLREATEGAGLNIAMLTFFALVTVTILRSQ